MVQKASAEVERLKTGGFSVRLQKYLADAGIASRRKCEELITAGRVSINGQTATLGQSINPGDVVEFDGVRVEPAGERMVYAFYKPQGVVCTSSDPQGRETVQDYFRDIPVRLYNIGRLDYDTEGLLLMTNDGALAHALTHPSREVHKTYYVICDGKLLDEQIRTLEAGVLLEEGITAPARVENAYRTSNANTSFYLTIHEGRNRQIRRMLKAVDHETLLLRRVGEGSLELGALRPGEKRRLTTAEIDALQKSCGMIT